VLNDRKHYDSYDPIENCRKELKRDRRVITVEDFGAGSRTGATNERTIASIAAHALKPKKFGQLLFRIAKYYGCKNILELGTSLGITSSYLASAAGQGKLVTMEGSPAIASVAAENFRKLGLSNTRIETGNFDETLEPMLHSLPVPDLVFIDGNHRHEPTVRYFKQLVPRCNNDTILIFDDVHWSEEMDAAWLEIKNDPRVTLTIDLFFIGLVFLRQESRVKQHFTIRF
jgi:predicted O-methyltransferase YrrM